MSPYNETSTLYEALKVLIIEDDEPLGQALMHEVKRSGMRAALAATGAEALALKCSFSPHVVLIDLELPDIDGIELVTILVQQGRCRIIILSGYPDEEDGIVGLEIGADDYLAKPPHLPELLARIRAVCRCVKTCAISDAEIVSRPLVQIGKIKVNFVGRSVHSEKGDSISLTSAEVTLLATMVAANGSAVSRNHLSEAALHRPWRPQDRSVDQLIFHLRHKLARCDDQPLIHAVRGEGYVLCPGTAGPSISIGD